MKNIIVGKIEQRSKITKNICWSDLWIIVISMFITILILNLKVSLWIRLAMCGALLTMVILSVADYGTGRKGYQELSETIFYIFRKKFIPQINFSAQRRIIAEEFLKIDNTFTAIYEINGIDFYMLDYYSQDIIIEQFHNYINELNEGSIVKLEKIVNLDNYILNCEKYKENLHNRSYGKATLMKMLDIHKENFQWYMEGSEVKTNFFYFIIKENNKEALFNLCGSFENMLNSNDMKSHRLEEKEIIDFIAEYMSSEPFFTPSVKEKFKTLNIGANYDRATKKYCGGVEKKIVSIAKYPYTIGNAWGALMFNSEGATVCMNFKRFGGKNLNKSIDRAIVNAGANTMMKGATATSTKEDIGKATALDSLADDVVFLDEKIFDVQCYLMFDAGKEREALKKIKADKFVIDYCFGCQKEAFVNMLPYNRIISNYKRYLFNQMQGICIAMSFPFVVKKLEDTDGMYLGYNENLVFFDPFERNTTRTNSNMAIIGSSGKGKSFLLKKLILELSGKNCKIFILDPEDEYRELCENLEGNYIDVAGSSKNKINPLQVFPSLKEESDFDNLGDIAQHRSFLKEFFKLIFPSLAEMQLLFIDKAINRVYTNFKIVDGVDIINLDNKKFPLMKDLYEEIKRSSKDKSASEGERTIYEQLSYLFEAFTEDGLYASNWNGSTTLKLDNPFNVLNFRNLFASNDKIKANAQMLLIMRYINLELIKNKELNEKNMRNENFMPRFMIEIVDEGHNFINAEFPVALEKIAQIAKQSRKYWGAIWFGSQNIADFLGGGDEVKARASSIINNCKYSAILGLQENDLNAIIELYSKTRPFTVSEREQLATGKLGKVLLAVDSNTRISLQIEAFDEEIKYFDYKAYCEVLNKRVNAIKEDGKQKKSVSTEKIFCINCPNCEEGMKYNKRQFKCNAINCWLGFSSNNIKENFIHKKCPNLEHKQNKKEEDIKMVDEDIKMVDTVDKLKEEQEQIILGAEFVPYNEFLNEAEAEAVIEFTPEEIVKLH